jgi:hypothetical protein
MRLILPLLGLLCVTSFSHAAGVTLKVELPADVKPKSGTSVATAMKLQTPGKVAPASVVFENLLPDTTYDVRLDLPDGTVLQGVDLGWYIPEEAAKPDAGPLEDDDRKEIATIVGGLQPFMNHAAILQLRGDHDRATALCEFSRDKGFVNDKGGEIIWRVELWYFKYQAGGWEAVAQVNKILRRERFKTRESYKATAEKLKWVPELGGIRVTADKSPLTIKLTPIAEK